MAEFLIGLDAADIQALPASGAAYTNMKTRADEAITAPDYAIGSREANKAFAAALEYVRSGTASYKTKVVTALDAISNPSTGWLAATRDHQVVNRQTAGWILAADLVGHRSAQMLDFADQIRTVDTSNGVAFTPPSMESNARYWSNNHATLAKASYMACTLYLGEALPSWVIPSIYCLWGDTSQGFGTYATQTPTQHADGYSVDSGGRTFEETWGLDYITNGWTPVNHVAGDPKKDGAVVHEVCRVTSNTYKNYSEDGNGDPISGNDFLNTSNNVNDAAYFATWMQGALVCNVLAEHNGEPGIWSAGSSTFGGTPGCLKAWQYALAYPRNWPLGAAPWNHTFTINKWVDSMALQKYPTLAASGFPDAAGTGYGFGFTDWLVIPNAQEPVEHHWEWRF